MPTNAQGQTDYADIFKRSPVDVKKPITADMALIEWDGTLLSTATNFALTYSQPITRRRTLGTSGRNIAVIYPGQPFGQISIQRLFCETISGEPDIFDRAGWNPCSGLTTVRIMFNGQSIIKDCQVTGGVYKAIGCLVTTYSLSGEAEGLTVIDNVQMEFLQLERTP